MQNQNKCVPLPHQTRTTMFNSSIPYTKYSNNKVINVPVNELKPTDSDFEFKCTEGYDQYIHEPIVIGTNGMIFDGHHRVKYCLENGIEFIAAVITSTNSVLNKMYLTVDVIESIEDALAFADSQK